MTRPRLQSSNEQRGWIMVTMPGDTGTVNHGKTRRGSHWTKDREHKREWEGLFLMAFMQERLPKNLAHVKVWVTFQFTDPGRKRDPENFRHPFAKPFADSLVKGGYLADDTRDYFELADVGFSTVKLAVTPVQKQMGLKSMTHIALIYTRRVAP